MSIDIQQACATYQQGDGFKLLASKLQKVSDYDVPARRIDVETAERELGKAKEDLARIEALKAELERGVEALKGIAV